MRGKIAIANAKAMYQRFQHIFSGDEFATLRRRGARVQRPLWASIGTKNTAYSDVLYVEELIGSETVDTIPPDTLGRVSRSWTRSRRHRAGESGRDGKPVACAVTFLGIDLNAITDKLQIDGVASFASAYDRVLDAIAKKVQDRPSVSV
jgi:transaldolase